MENQTLFQQIAAILSQFDEDCSTDDLDLHDYIYISKQLESGCSLESIVSELFGECSCA